MPEQEHRLGQAELNQLRRWSTPSVYNGWEQITRADAGRDGFNPEETRDYMPEMGPMAGYAVTVIIEPGNPEHPRANPRAWDEYLSYAASVGGPKIVVVQDLDKPRTAGSFWGEVNGSAHRALGCVGTITDGGIRDLDEVRALGFKTLARWLCVGHAHSTPVRWGCPVEVFGREVRPGQLIHADRHGFLAVPPGDESRLLEAVRFMDANECRTVIAAAQNTAGMETGEILRRLAEARAVFRRDVLARLAREGEW